MAHIEIGHEEMNGDNKVGIGAVAEHLEAKEQMTATNEIIFKKQSQQVKKEVYGTC